MGNQNAESKKRRGVLRVPDAPCNANSRRFWQPCIGFSTTSGISTKIGLSTQFWLWRASFPAPYPSSNDDSKIRNIPENTADPRLFRGRPLRDGGPSLVSLLQTDHLQFQDRLEASARRRGGAEAVQRGRSSPAGVQLVARGETKDGLGTITEVSDAANAFHGPSVTAGQRGIIEIDFHEAAN